jgi:hypothetical protein
VRPRPATGTTSSTRFRSTCRCLTGSSSALPGAEGGTPPPPALIMRRRPGCRVSSLIGARRQPEVTVGWRGGRPSCRTPRPLGRAGQPVRRPVAYHYPLCVGGFGESDVLRFVALELVEWQGRNLYPHPYVVIAMVPVALGGVTTTPWRGSQRWDFTMTLVPVGKPGIVGTSGEASVSRLGTRPPF